MARTAKVSLSELMGESTAAQPACQARQPLQKLSLNIDSFFDEEADRKAMARGMRIGKAKGMCVGEDTVRNKASITRCKPKKCICEDKENTNHLVKRKVKSKKVQPKAKITQPKKKKNLTKHAAVKGSTTIAKKSAKKTSQIKQTPKADDRMSLRKALEALCAEPGGKNNSARSKKGGIKNSDKRKSSGSTFRELLRQHSEGNEPVNSQAHQQQTKQPPKIPLMPAQTKAEADTILSVTAAITAALAAIAQHDSLLVDVVTDQQGQDELRKSVRKAISDSIHSSQAGTASNCSQNDRGCSSSPRPQLHPPAVTRSYSKNCSPTSTALLAEANAFLQLWQSGGGAGESQGTCTPPAAPAPLATTHLAPTLPGSTGAAVATVPALGGSREGARRAEAEAGAEVESPPARVPSRLSLEQLTLQTAVAMTPHLKLESEQRDALLCSMTPGGLFMSTIKSALRYDRTLRLGREEEEEEEEEEGERMMDVCTYVREGAQDVEEARSSSGRVNCQRVVEEELVEQGGFGALQEKENSAMMGEKMEGIVEQSGYGQLYGKTESHPMPQNQKQHAFDQQQPAPVVSLCLYSLDDAGKDPVQKEEWAGVEDHACETSMANFYTPPSSPSAPSAPSLHPSASIISSVTAHATVEEQSQPKPKAEDYSDVGCKCAWEEEREYSFV